MVITNQQTKNLEYQVERLAKKSDRIDIATAFFTESNLIKGWHDENKEINVLVSLRPPTSYYSLKAIQPLPNVQTNFLGKEFHSKFILFYKDNDFVGGIIGSSNFTSGGLIKNTETNILIQDKKVLNKLENHYADLISNSNLLQPTDLGKYELIYKNWIERQKKENAELEKFEKKITKNRTKRNSKPRINKIANQYFAYWNIVDEIRDLIKDTAQKEYPKIPVYLVLDHFWHYVKTVWFKEKEMVLKSNNQRQIIPQLFKKYIKWQKTFDDDFPKYMNKQSKYVFKVLLSKKNVKTLNKEQAKEVFGSLHSTNMAIQRFDADNHFVALNGLPKIRKSLDYLVHSNDEMNLKIYNLMKNPEYKLEKLGPSGIQEINGWTYPKKYPIRNKKADDAIKILGYELE